ncbi:FAD-dependent oxidoreductase [Thermodesulfobacteriota bacterium]
MNKSRLYQPIKIRNHVIKNRVIQAPGANLLCSDTGVMTQEALEWAKVRAKGGAGVVSVGQSMVNPTPPDMSGFVLDLTTDKVINGLFRMAEMIRQFGAKSTIELVYMDFGTPDVVESDLTSEDLTKIRTQDSTSINDKMAKKMPAELSVNEIKTIINYYAEAAVRCKRAGFDMVLVHGAHGMFISDFLSSIRNERTDEYGGSFENRSRLVVEILEGIRDAVGPRMAIEYRLSAEEKIKDGLTLEDQITFAKHIESRIDSLYVSTGVLENDEMATYIFPPAYYNRGVNVHYAKHFKDVLSIPVGTVGGIDMALAEKIVDEDRSDIVTMLRATIADPDLVNKARRGSHEDIRPCVRCNTCITQPHYYFLPVRCAVNPEAGRECDVLRIPPPKKSKKVIVIGGGPGGMEAARTAADRGHEVILYEKADRLGGMLITASANSLKTDMQSYLGWAVRQTEKSPGINIKLGTRATPESIAAENPDAVVVAAGASPLLPPIPGLDRENCVWAGDVETGDAGTGNRVVVAGGGLTGLEAAIRMAKKGRKVTVVEMQSYDNIVMTGPVVNMVALSIMMRENGVKYLSETTVTEIKPEGVLVRDAGGNERIIECDTVVHALGMEPNREEADKFTDIADEVYYAGDCCVERGTLWSAISSAHYIALEL